MQTYTLSLDPSLRAFGWAVLSDTDIVDGGCIVTATKMSDIESITLIVNDIKHILGKWLITEVFIENPIGSKSNRAAMGLSLVKGAALAACIMSGLSPSYVTARSVKSKLTGKSDAEKSEVYDIVAASLPSLPILVKDKNKVHRYAVSDAAAVCLSTRL